MPERKLDRMYRGSVLSTPRAAQNPVREDALLHPPAGVPSLSELRRRFSGIDDLSGKVYGGCRNPKGK